MAGLQSGFYSLRLLLTHFINRQKLLLTLRLLLSSSSYPPSVRPSMHWHTTMMRFFRMCVRNLSSSNATLWNVDASCIARNMRLADTEGPHRYHPSFLHLVLCPTIIGFFWEMPSASTLSAAHASTRCSIRQRICGTRDCPWKENYPMENPHWRSNREISIRLRDPLAKKYRIIHW